MDMDSPVDLDGWLPPGPTGEHPAAKLPQLTLHGGRASAEEIVRRLDEHGCCVVERLISQDQVARLVAQLEAAGAAADLPTPFTGEGGDGLDTHDVTRLGAASVVHAPLMRSLCEHPLIVSACEAVLTRHCKAITLKIVAPIWLGTQRRQLLHHEDGLWPAGPHAGHEFCVDCIWALDDFSESNGSTLVVPGSNRWPRSSFTRRQPPSAQPQQSSPADDSLGRAALQVCMPKGSVLLFTGSTLHGGGENTTAAHARRVLIGYQLGWLRQEHKFWAHRQLYDRVGEFSERLQLLLGFDGVPAGAEKKEEEEAGTMIPAEQRAAGRSTLRCEPGSYAYLSRTPQQVASQLDSRKHIGVENDEPFYHGPLVIPKHPAARAAASKGYGLFIERLRQWGRL